MKCLVTGATGFVGRELCGQLVAQGHDLVPMSHSGAVLDDGTPTHALDLVTSGVPATLWRGVQVVFHLAGIAHQHAPAELYERLNHQATLELARAAEQAGVGCFIFLSSVKSMGPAPGQQSRSEHDVTEATESYGQSKWRAECGLRSQLQQSAMKLLILRPALVYGREPRANLAMLLAAARRGWPAPPSLGERSMVALEDLVALLLQLVESAPAGTHTWIVCDGYTYSARSIYDQARVAMGLPPGRAWLPLWLWAVGCWLRDTLGNGESTYQKIFGNERYDGRAVTAATGWRPRLRLSDVMPTLVARVATP